MENSIKYLNTKVWYRLLKVVFVTLAFLIVGFSWTLIFSHYGTNAYDDYRMYCEDAGNTNFLAWTEKRILVLSSDLDNWGSKDDLRYNDKNKEVEKICNHQDREPEFFIRAIKVIPEKVVTGSTAIAVLYSILATLGILITAEVLKRVFYYILTGSFRQK